MIATSLPRSVGTARRMHLRVETCLRKRRFGRTSCKYSCVAVLACLAASGRMRAVGRAEPARPARTGRGRLCRRPAVRPCRSVTLGGRTVAFETSEVRPQVDGLIRRRIFTEGSFVRQGQPLYQIDPSLYRAAVNQAQANLASARATPTRRRPGPTATAAGGDGGRRQAGLHRRRGRRPGRRAPRSRRTAPRSRPRRSTCASPPSRRRSAAGSAARCSPSARWSPPTRPSRWR